MDLQSFELHNAVLKNGQVTVRDALYQHVVATTLMASTEFVYGFSVEASNTSEVFHYLFLRKTATGDGYAMVCTEEYREVARYYIGPISLRPRITYAVQDRQILINSPEFAPIYGLVGSGLIRALKQDSVNPSTTAIEIPSGICYGFGDRIAIAQGNIIYFNDAGTEIRTFVGENVVALVSTIYDMFEGPGGSLCIATADGIWSIPSDALGQGQEVVGMLSKISAYQASRGRNAVANRNQIFALTQTGLGLIGDTVQSIQLTTYDAKRFYSQYVGPGKAGDYRTGALYRAEKGCLIACNGKVCLFDLDTQKATWVYNTGEIELVGVCRSRDGVDLWVTKDSILELHGNVEYDNQSLTGVACGRFDSDPADSIVVREVTTAADNVGLAQVVYIGGAAKTATTPKPSRASNVVGTNLWSNTNTMVGQETRSRRHLFNVRTDSLDVEVGATGCGAKLGPVSFVAKGAGRRRPTE